MKESNFLPKFGGRKRNWKYQYNLRVVTPYKEASKLLGWRLAEEETLPEHARSVNSSMPSTCTPHGGTDK